jgi:low affinity Fe/Cu permease
VSREKISRFVRSATFWAGSGTASVVAVLVATGWVVAGIVWRFPEKWHLWLHTTASLVTLVMVFVIQHTTNKESRATLVKLDELLRVHEAARGEIMAVENADLASQERLEREMEDHPHSAPG